MLFSLLFRKNIRKMEEDQLLQLVREKNNEAEGELFRRYAHLVFGLCLKYMKSTDDAQDMMMVIFESLFDKFRKSEVTYFKSWLYSVARNECLMVLRKKKPEQQDFETTLITEADVSTEELKLAVLKEDQIVKLEEAIEQLKDEQKICVELFYLRKKCYDEIAEETGYDLKKVKSYIQNGKRNLKLILEKQSEFRA